MVNWIKVLHIGSDVWIGSVFKMCTTNTQGSFEIQLACNRSSNMSCCNCLDLSEQSPVSFTFYPHILSNISPGSIFNTL